MSMNKSMRAADLATTDEARSNEEWMSLHIDFLKKRCRTLGLASLGRKQVLVDRLLEHYVGKPVVDVQNGAVPQNQSTAILAASPARSAVTSHDETQQVPYNSAPSAQEPETAVQNLRNEALGTLVRSLQDGQSELRGLFTRQQNMFLDQSGASRTHLSASTPSQRANIEPMHQQPATVPVSAQWLPFGPQLTAPAASPLVAYTTIRQPSSTPANANVQGNDLSVPSTPSNLFFRRQ